MLGCLKRNLETYAGYSAGIKPGKCESCTQPYCRVTATKDKKFKTIHVDERWPNKCEEDRAEDRRRHAASL